MNNKIFLVFKKELREVFRDKKSLSMMLIIPIMIPLLVIGMSALFESQANTEVNQYNKVGFAYEFTDMENSLAQSLSIDATFGSKDEILDSFQKGEIYTYIEKKDNNYVIYYDDANVESSQAANLAQNFLESLKASIQTNYLTNHDIDLEEYNSLLTYEFGDVEKQNFYANYMINYAFLFIIMAITISATYPATDTTAGERERGTLETLLTFPIKSRDIILGKLLCVTTSSFITGIISQILAIISIIFAEKTFSIYEGISLINGHTIIISFLIILAYSFLISGLCIAFASMSKTFKEAQSALTPLTFISFFPGMIVFMLDITNTAILSLVPFVNYTMIFQDVTSGIYNYFHIFLMFLSTFIFISVVIFYIVRQYKSENVLFTS